MPGDILDLIDCALEDCSASDDAMRWNPEPARVICDGGRPLQPERWSLWRHGTWSYAVTAIDAAGEAAEGATVELSPAGPVTSCEVYGLRFDDDNELRGGRAMLYDLQSAPPWTATFTFSVSPETRAAVSRMFHFDHPLPRRRYSRCPLCNPRGNPGRLAIDGREYARRRRARKRR